MSRAADAARPWASKDGAAAEPKILGSARSMRREPTQAERKLWRMLRTLEIQQSHFRRQVVVEGFIADFACYRSRAIIEVDGGQHCESLADQRRTDALGKAGCRVLRSWNNEVLENIEGVRERIVAALDVDERAPSGTTPTPDPSPQGGGEK